ncbi:PepSY domain-containing protein [Herbaspirillum huttiense]|uniref:PepSY domain-containing protein n=1 Tax=Herbaspirillum huttiense TaxID=863372 RepID=UPI00381BC783
MEGIELVVLVLIAMTAASAGYYWSFKREQQDRLTMSTAKLSLSQAVDKAIMAAGGQPVVARLVTKHGQPVFKVVLVRGEQFSKLKIDALTGVVLDIEHEDQDGLERWFGQRSLG